VSRRACSRARSAAWAGWARSQFLRVAWNRSTFPWVCGWFGQAIHVSAGRVEAARDRAQHRLAGTPWRLNGDIPAVELRRSYLPPPEAMAVVHRAVDLGRISVLTAHRVLRVAWTLADLEGLDHPGQDECSQAFALHLGGFR
jgi:magnesium chelatase family protein